MILWRKKISFSLRGQLNAFHIGSYQLQVSAFHIRGLDARWLLDVPDAMGTLLPR